VGEGVSATRTPRLSRGKVGNMNRRQFVHTTAGVAAFLAMRPDMSCEVSSMSHGHQPSGPEAA